MRSWIQAGIVAACGVGAGTAYALSLQITRVDAAITGPSTFDTFRRPASLAVSQDGRLFLVGDTGNHRIAVFDASGRCRGTFPLSPADPTSAGVEPQSLALDSRGRIYVVDGLDHLLTVLSSRGAFVASQTVPTELAPEGGEWVRSVAVAPSGRIYVLHTGPAAGLYSELPGGRASTAHDIRSGLKSLIAPVAVAVNADETQVAVLDPEGDRQVQVRMLDGTLLASFGRHGEGEGTLSLAVHVAWGPSDTLWITDTLRHFIHVFDAHGAYLGRVGGFGTSPGQFSYPVACGFLEDGRLVVLERAGRCQILEVTLSDATHAALSGVSAHRSAPSVLS